MKKIHTYTSKEGTEISYDDFYQFIEALDRKSRKEDESHKGKLRTVRYLINTRLTGSALKDNIKEKNACHKCGRHKYNYKHKCKNISNNHKCEICKKNHHISVCVKREFPYIQGNLQENITSKEYLQKNLQENSTCKERKISNTDDLSIRYSDHITRNGRPRSNSY